MVAGVSVYAEDYEDCMRRRMDRWEDEKEGEMKLQCED